jgi:hypothetical protein
MVRGTFLMMNSGLPRDVLPTVKLRAQRRVRARAEKGEGARREGRGRAQRRARARAEKGEAFAAHAHELALLQVVAVQRHVRDDHASLPVGLDVAESCPDRTRVHGIEGAQAGQQTRVGARRDQSSDPVDVVGHRGGHGLWWEGRGGGVCGSAREVRRKGAGVVDSSVVEVPSRGKSNFEEQDASWGEGERELWKEERGGGGEEGVRGRGRSRTGV